MPTAYIALGSNLGDRWALLTTAIARLRAEPGLRLLSRSSIHETAPVNCPPNSNTFYNAVVAVETERTPEDVLRLLLRIERQFGRVRTELNSPRTLDLDLILHGDAVINTPELTLPHPRMHEREFVLAPLAEIAPHVIHPVLGKPIQELADAVHSLGIRRIAGWTPEPESLRGLNALVTGSTTGIGEAIARKFRARKAEVIHHGRRENHNPHLRYMPADLRDPVEVSRLANDAWNAFTGLDILVCNAGADTLTGDAAKWSFEQKLEALLAVDLKATMQLTRDIGARMKARGRGCIITIGWDQAETGMEGDSGQLFAAVKGAVMCFTRSLALELAPEVRVNCIAPGWIRTAWGETASQVWQDRVRRETPLEVWGLANDIANTAAWLADPASAFITGQTIRVNGGAVRA
jgi:2-amino-4-hydroxy-6-hydroxymethyldihydropteridine diphosphokinase